MSIQPTALRSVLNPRYLESALRNHYDIGTWEECLFWLRGLNDTYRVRTSSGMYILRSTALKSRRQMFSMSFHYCLN